MKENVLFLLIDCLRLDRCLRKNVDPKNTPFIDYLCLNGTSFTQAISVTSFTSPAVASILTGVYPFTHGIEWFDGKLNSECITLPQILRKAGYTTYAMVTGPLLSQLGIDRGFDRFLHRKEDETIYSGFKAQLESYLESLKKPWFLFVHLWELHYPVYLPNRSKFNVAPDKYDKALSYLDQALLTIAKKIDLDETIILLHADHGERLPSYFESIASNLLSLSLEIPVKNKNEFQFKLLRDLFQYFPFLRKKQGHGFHIYDPLIRVPLIFAGGRFPKNKVVKEKVSQIDILPTIIDVLELKDLDIKLNLPGRSLLPLLNNQNGAWPERADYIGPGGIRDIWPPKKDEWLEGLRTTKWKYISVYNKDQPIELYDLQNDPKELNNLVEVRKDIVEKFKEELKKIKSSRPRTYLNTTKEEKETMKSRLKALGYI